MWHEGLEEASRLYFGEHNIEGMLKVLEPLHEMLEEGAMKSNTTINEMTFIQVVDFPLTASMWSSLVWANRQFFFY